MLVLPDADVSEPEVEEDSDEEHYADEKSEESSDPSHSDEEEVSGPSKIAPPKRKSSAKRAKTTWKPLSAADKKSNIPEFNGPSNDFEDSLTNRWVALICMICLCHYIKLTISLRSGTDGFSTGF